MKNLISIAFISVTALISLLHADEQAALDLGDIVCIENPKYSGCVLASPGGHPDRAAMSVVLWDNTKGSYLSMKNNEIRKVTIYLLTGSTIEPMEIRADTLRMGREYGWNATAVWEVQRLFFSIVARQTLAGPDQHILVKVETAKGTQSFRWEVNESNLLKAIDNEY